MIEKPQPKTQPGKVNTSMFEQNIQAAKTMPPAGKPAPSRAPPKVEKKESSDEEPMAKPKPVPGKLNNNWQKKEETSEEADKP